MNNDYDEEEQEQEQKPTQQYSITQNITDTIVTKSQ